MKLDKTGILLLAGILIFINLLSRQFYFRWDVTENNQYTLSTATKDILKNLEEPVLVRAFFTENLPQQYQKPQEDFRNLLTEYANRSRSMVDFEFIDPSASPESEQDAVQNGISPLLINVREKDQAVQKKAFMGAVIQAGEQKDVIPFVQPEGPLEYQLTTSIKKVSSIDKPSIAFIQGHGEADGEALQLAEQMLSVLYQVERIDLHRLDAIDHRFQAIAMIKPQDTIPPSHLVMMDAYLEQGGQMFLATDFVDGNFQNAQGSRFSVGLENWLERKGLRVLPKFIIDANCGSVSVQQQQGPFRFNTAVDFPYFPMVTQFGDHPVTKGLEQVAFQMVSPIEFMGDSSIQFTPLVKTSSQSGTLDPPLFFDIEKRWQSSDFPLSALTIGGLLEQSNGSKLILFSDGDFAVGAQGRGQTPDNVSLMVNSIDYLSDDTGLIDLRTKGVASRPIEEMEEDKMARIKWTNFLLPICLVLLYGIYRFQRNRNIRVRRMEEKYE